MLTDKVMFIAMVYWLWRRWGRKNIDFDNRKSRSSKFYCDISVDQSESGNLEKKNKTEEEDKA